MQNHDPYLHMPPRSTRTAPDLTTKALIGVAKSRPVRALVKWCLILLAPMIVAASFPKLAPFVFLAMLGFVAYIAYRVYRRIAAAQYARVAHRDEAQWTDDYAPDQPMSSPAPYTPHIADSPNPWGV